MSISGSLIEFALARPRNCWPDELTPAIPPPKEPHRRLTFNLHNTRPLCADLGLRWRFPSRLQPFLAPPHAGPHYFRQNGPSRRSARLAFVASDEPAQYQGHVWRKQLSVPRDEGLGGRSHFSFSHSFRIRPGSEDPGCEQCHSASHRLAGSSAAAATRLQSGLPASPPGSRLRSVNHVFFVGCIKDAV